MRETFLCDMCHIPHILPEHSKPIRLPGTSAKVCDNCWAKYGGEGWLLDQDRQPIKLSKKQREAYERDGWVVIGRGWEHSRRVERAHQIPRGGVVPVKAGK